MRKSLPAFTFLGWILASTLVLGDEPGSKPAIRVRLSHPDKQLHEVIDLFKKAKAPDPASALAAWKRASKEPNRLGKPLEALITAFNPRMVEELKTLEGAEVSIWFDSETGQPEWSAVLPKDDGTFSALASALALSGGAAEAPMVNVAVDRLAGPGSPLMAKFAQGTLLASTREGLKAAKERLERPGDRGQEVFAGLEAFHLSVERGSLQGSKSLSVRRLEELIRPSKNLFNERTGPVELTLSMDSGGLLASMGFLDGKPGRRGVVDPTWLDWIPKDRAMVGFAIAIDPAAKSWEALFGLADRVEKLDPARADVAPIQVRLDLMARLVGIRAETEVLHHLKGITGWVGSNGKAIDGAFVALHIDDQSAAERVVARVKPLPGSAPIPPTQVGQPRSLGQLDGRTLRISRVERAVILTWGEGVLEASMLARDKPERSAGPEIREFWLPDRKTSSGVGLWPGRIPGIWPEGSPLAKAITEAPPLICQAYADEVTIDLFAIWPHLDETVKRFLDLIPLDPPPDH